MVLDPGADFAGFTIEALLGRGGMGEVYRARHPRLPRRVAVKVLTDSAALDESFRQRFDREADLAARTNHRNIVTVYDRGIEGDRPWICMEYVPGSDLAALLRRHRAGLPVEQAAYILAEAAAGLDHAHRQGLLHRDIKPANILLAPGDPGERDRVLLSDFGIARSVDESTGLTSTGAFVATIAYAAPETFTGAEVGSRADLYSLGATLFEMLTGTVPFRSATPAAVMHAHLTAPIPAPTGLRPDLPAALDAILARALAKQPAQRYGTARELSEATRAALRAPAPPRPAPTPPADFRSLPTQSAASAATRPGSPPDTTQPGPAPRPAQSGSDPQIAQSGSGQTAQPGPTPRPAPQVSAPHAGQSRSRTPQAPSAALSSSAAAAERETAQRARFPSAPKSAASGGILRSRRRRLLALAAAVAAVLVAGGLVVGYNTIRSGYYVGADSGAVAVFRGRPGTVVGFTVRDVEEHACFTGRGEVRFGSSVTEFTSDCHLFAVSDLRASARASVVRGMPVGSHAQARAQIEGLVQSELLPPCASATPGSTPPTAAVTPTAPPLGVPATASAPVTPPQNCRTAN